MTVCKSIIVIIEKALGIIVGNARLILEVKPKTGGVQLKIV